MEKITTIEFKIHFVIVLMMMMMIVIFLVGHPCHIFRFLSQFVYIVFL